MISVSTVMQQVREEAALAASAEPGRVLFVGEAGVGKEHLARVVHQAGSRRRGPFVAIRCGTASDLAVAMRAGAGADPLSWLAQEARGGTLLLKGVQELSAPLQMTLMPLIDRCAGGEIDVRIAATASPAIFDAVTRGSFYPDLYYRLNTVLIEVPPLRERREDLEPMLRLFLAQAAQRLGVRCPPFREEWRRVLRTHPWPGNARELREVAEAIVTRRVTGAAPVVRMHRAARPAAGVPVTRP